MATNFMGKIGKIGLLTFIRCRGIVAFQNGLEYRNSDLKRFNRNDLTTSFKNLVIFVSITPDVTTVIGVHPSSISNALDGATVRH